MRAAELIVAAQARSGSNRRPSGRHGREGPDTGTRLPRRRG
jgi:hypothetical protein